MAYRDECSDTGRLGDGNQALRGNDLAGSQDWTPDTIAGQMANGGWTKGGKPEGGTPAPIGYTVGLRGQND